MEVRFSILPVAFVAGNELDSAIMTLMDQSRQAIGRHVQRNGRYMELLCAHCNFLGELDATELDISSPDLWQNAAERFSALGWTCRDERPACPACSAE
jgi:hypothetical protein